MRKFLLFSILILGILLTGACKSKPAPAVDESANTRVPVTATPAAPPTTTPEPAPTTTTPTATTPGTAYETGTGSDTGTAAETTSSAATGTASSNTANRHSSGVILDGATNYRVVRGDTLSRIARHLYHDGSYYPLIKMVNTNIVSDPDEILPLMNLIIPNLQVNMNDPQARESINTYFLYIADIEDQRGRHRTARLIRNHVTN